MSRSAYFKAGQKIVYFERDSFLNSKDQDKEPLAKGIFIGYVYPDTNDVNMVVRITENNNNMKKLGTDTVLEVDGLYCISEDDCVGDNE